MDNQIKNPAEPAWTPDEELSDDELDSVTGGGISNGAIKGGNTSSSGNSGTATNTQVGGSSGFSGPAVRRP